MSNRYWNGHCWRDNVDTMSKLEPVATVVPAPPLPTEELHSLYGDPAPEDDVLVPCAVTFNPPAKFDYAGRTLRDADEVFAKEAMADFVKPSHGAGGLPPSEPAKDDRGMTYREESANLPQIDHAKPDHSKCTKTACSSDCDGPAARKQATDRGGVPFRKG